MDVIGNLLNISGIILATMGKAAVRRALIATCSVGALLDMDMVLSVISLGQLARISRIIMYMVIRTMIFLVIPIERIGDIMPFPMAAMRKACGGP